MKILEPRKYRPSTGTLGEVLHYLTHDLQIFLSNLIIGLTKLQIDDNFNGWVEKDITIKANSELEIINRLGEAVSYKIILRGGDGAQFITDGEEPWTIEKVYLKNQAPTDMSGLTVVFLK